jgi:hypothetical protein
MIDSNVHFQYHGVTAGLEAAAFGAVTISPVLYIITVIMLYKNKQ